MLALTIGLGLSAMCGDSPTAPGGGGAVRSLVGVEVVGPASLAPGESAQYTLEVVYNDGTRGEPTQPVTWSAGASTVLSTDASGRVTGHDKGRGSVSARLGNRESRREVVVVPARTYWLDGTVTETGSTSFALSNTKVMVLTGTGAGTTAVSSASGTYSLFGVAGAVTLRFERSGYSPRELEVVVSAPQILNADLEVIGGRVSLSGSYAVTMTVPSECRGQLPESAWERHYSAQLQQNGGAITVTLGGATFADYSGILQNSFRGTLFGDRLELSISLWSYYYGYPGLVERLTDDAWFAPDVTGTLIGTSSEMRGTLDGSIYILRASGAGERATSCSSKTLDVVLTR